MENEKPIMVPSIERDFWVEAEAQVWDGFELTPTANFRDAAVVAALAADVRLLEFKKRWGTKEE